MMVFPRGMRREPTTKVVASSGPDYLFGAAEVLDPGAASEAGSGVAKAGSIR